MFLRLIRLKILLILIILICLRAKIQGQCLEVWKVLPNQTYEPIDAYLSAHLIILKIDL
jgi:hypothetical protein